MDTQVQKVCICILLILIAIRTPEGMLVYVSLIDCVEWFKPKDENKSNKNEDRVFRTSVLISHNSAEDFCWFSM